MCPGPLYATAAIAGATTYVLLVRFEILPDAASLAGMGVIAVLRLAAILWRLELPAVRLPEDEAG